MKKLFSLLFVALLTMSAWADTVVTVDFNAQGWSTNTLVTDLTVDGVTLTFDKGTNANSNKPTYFTNTSGGALRLYGGNTMTIVAPQNLKKIDFTFLSGEDSNNILSDVGNYNKAGKQWTIGSSDPSAEVVFTIEGSSGHRRIQSLVITMEDAEPVTGLQPPVFDPNGGEFSGSLAVNVSCATENASIYVYKVIDGEIDYYSSQYFFESGVIYVNQTMTYAAYSAKGSEYSDYVYVTFTQIPQTVEAPVFTPEPGIFEGRIDVTLTCATPNAVIYYSLDNDLWSRYETPIPVTTDITIWAKAKVGSVESEVVSANYNRKPEDTYGIVFDPHVDTVGITPRVRQHYTVIKEPVSMYVGDGMVSEQGQYRIYGPTDTSGVVFTSAAGAIVKIEFFGLAGYGANHLSPVEGDVCTWITSGYDGVWEGYANEVAFDVNMQVRFTKIIVTVVGQEPGIMLGDVNHDGKLSVADVTALIHWVLSDPDNAPAEADVNESGSVTVADVTALISLVLSLPSE